MAKKQWNVNIADKLHVVEVDWSRWSTSGEIRVDGNVVQAWGSGLFIPREVKFMVEGTEAFLRRKGIFSVFFIYDDFDLYVGGRKY